jgi:hypothetical protein
MHTQKTKYRISATRDFIELSVLLPWLSFHEATCQTQDLKQALASHLATIAGAKKPIVEVRLPEFSPSLALVPPPEQFRTTPTREYVTGKSFYSLQEDRRITE